LCFCFVSHWAWRNSLDSCTVAFGLVCPAIIVPIDIVRAGGDDLECVLLHELAHVRRRDPWSHTFERFVQALLFFNPAVVLLLQSIALEREAACDDWAVAHSHDAPKYARSLATLAVRTGVGADVLAACGAMGFGHAIINRIERLEDLRHNGSLTLSPYALGGFAFMLITIALSLQMLAPAIAFSPQMHISQVAAAPSKCTQSVMVTFPASTPDSLPAGSATIKVSVSPTGAVTAATISQSSGNATFDRAAITAAKESGYTPAMRNCKPVAGFYLFKLSNPGVK
jgi:TonB family protein